MIDLIYWLADVGTNEFLFRLIDNNSALLFGGWGMLMLVLKYRAKKTPSPDDDEFIENVDNTVKNWFSASIQKRAHKM